MSVFSILNGSPLKSDETVFFFPTSANLDQDSKWAVPIHHWVFEKEENDITNKLSQKLLSEIIETFGVSEEQASSKLFRQRLMWFLVDNERRKRIEITVEDQANNKITKKLNLTSANGHATTFITFPSCAKQNGWLNIQATDDKRLFKGKVQLIPKTGFTVISDIDDTIKVSNVLDKKALIRNVFVKPYQATEGMPGFYKELQEQGAYFHYVSASPWQLYPSLKPFMDKYYPPGTVSLRDFRLKDSSVIKFLQSSLKYKTEQIKQIIQRYPKHTFTLIGDSGEHDPEVYASIHKHFPDIKFAILIRAVKGSDTSDQRFNKTFHDVPKDEWAVFDSPVE